MRFEVTWALGGRDLIEADSGAEAHEIMRDRLPSGDCDWTDIEAIEVRSGG